MRQAGQSIRGCMGARYGRHQGIPIPRLQYHNAMNFMGSGGLARTRTWDSL